MDATGRLGSLIGSPGLDALARTTGDGVIESSKREESGFGDLVGRTLAKANDAQIDAEAQVRELAAGRGDVVETMLALSNADIALRTTLQLRNRALEAYQEILRVQV